MSELQDLYESINPIPEHISRCGNGYCQHVYMLIDPYASGYKDRFEGFKHGLQHQQSKVDELQKQKSLQELEINQIAHANQQWQLKCGELQKRVDESLRILVDIKKKGLIGSQYSIFDLEQALKGGSDASN